MRVLLDENMPQAFRFHLPGHDVASTKFKGWDELSDTELIANMLKDQFQVLITLDQNLPYQQQASRAKIAVIVLKPITGRFRNVVKLANDTLRALKFIQPGQVVTILPT
ncbi:MAG: hypothetical protein FWD61_19775 [Phycisphaerales bacterium]|nr:hypothetical protein [Phycisphaerales bacterium]